MHKLITLTHIIDFFFMGGNVTLIFEWRARRHACSMGQGPNIERSLWEKNINEKKKDDPQAKPTSPYFNPRVTQVFFFFFLLVENINPPHKKLQVMRVNSMARPILPSLKGTIKEMKISREIVDASG